MKWQAVVTGEHIRPVGGHEAPRPGAGGGRSARPRKSVRRLPAHACLALLMLGSVMGGRR
jgi:hypothetical protein